jgi:DnaA family protein
MRQLLLDFTRAPEPTFANFVPGGNAEAARALEAAASDPLGVFYVWGESGGGKTHLLKAFAARAGGRARYVPAGDFDPRRVETEPGIAWAIDGVERLSEQSQAALFNAFNAQAFAALAVSAHAAPRDVALRRDLATRLATGLVYRILPLTDEEKRDALAAHARARGFALTEEVSGYLLTHARRDMGSLISALDALDRFSLESGRAITVPLLKAAMQPELRLGGASGDGRA